MSNRLLAPLTEIVLATMGPYRLLRAAFTNLAGVDRLLIFGSSAARPTSLARPWSATPSCWNAVFLIHRLRPWSRNPLARAVRRPKVHLVDTGLLCHLLNVNEQCLSRIESRELRPVAETYVVNELRKPATWAETDVTLRHFRDSHGNSEVDVIAETQTGGWSASRSRPRSRSLVATSSTVTA